MVSVPHAHLGQLRSIMRQPRYLIIRLVFLKNRRKAKLRRQPTDIPSITRFTTRRRVWRGFAMPHIEDTLAVMSEA